ncbi:Vacuolar protein sorting-associated protein 26A-like [Heracleum sosnowskyi]|uniref:Vacuolar protein sorting-associated protein 26A-like n=1 Tax=Heracleum sosnowskyi TaxID=360622 RepID=A0AAD8H8M7_9APIA|nr:Vacuolar protein sorting-associated protein 26A-like [Heracleum sosnowskyi]
MSSQTQGVSRRFEYAFHRNPQMALTKKGSPAYSNADNPCLDFFFQVIIPHYTSSSSLSHHLKKAWDHDPLTTLKLICNIRGVKGTGKADKENFYTAALWLHENHNKNLACNLSAMASFGYLKDMLEILFLLLEGSQARAILKSSWESKKNHCKARNEMRPYNRQKPTRKEVEKDKRLRELLPREGRVEANDMKMKVESEMASILRKEKRIERAKKLSKLYNRDRYFEFLYENVSSLFADMLKADMDCFNSGKTNQISLAAKWCPSLDSFYDKYTYICGSIAKKVFPRESYPEYEGLEDAHYEYRVRDRLRKQVLVPLREVLQLPEVYMSAQEWNSLAYTRVASVAMKNYTDVFMWHDKERFTKYLEEVKEGKAKIAAGALFPHDIIKTCLQGESEGKETVAELQWKRMVDDMLQKGKLSNTIAVCDVSAYISPISKNVSLGLGLLLSEISEGPWKGQVITFSQNPQLHFIQGNSLLEKCKYFESLEYGHNTNFRRVFDQILNVALVANLSREQMIKRVFVFSHMEFSQASPNKWETDYQAIRKKFKKNGYEVPEIVFWNLSGSCSTPVTAKQTGVALLSGFSKNLFKLFLDHDGAIDPEIAMEIALSRKEYEKLVCYDD